MVRPNPVLFQLPEPSSSEDVESKENQTPAGEKDRRPGGSLHYRSIFAVLTLDSVLIYDTHHANPLSIIRGLHYAGLTDCCWTRDGHSLMVCSTDGYISIINFNKDELGQVYKVPEAPLTPVELPKERLLPTTAAPIPPCRPGTAVLEARPAKRTRITPTLVSGIDANASPVAESPANKRSICPETESVGAAVTKLSLENAAAAGSGGEEKPKKKKRIQPLLISS